MAEQAILFEVDLCTRCRGCQIACQRNMGIDARSGTAEKLERDDLVVVKSQMAQENPPYVRYSCWHCAESLELRSGPPCAPRCPFNAIVKLSSGAVIVNHNVCDPLSPKCKQQCLKDCIRGGFPKIGEGGDAAATYKMWKCNLCNDWTNYGGETGPAPSGWVNRWLPLNSSKKLSGNRPNRTGVPNPGQPYNTYSGTTGPACVVACPNNALKFDDRGSIVDYLNYELNSDYSPKYPYKCGDGSVMWASRGAIFAPPTSDPFAEDHVVPMFQRLMSGSTGKALAIPGILAAGLYALYQRKLEVETEK